MDFVIAFVILAAGITPVLLWARFRWKKLKPELFSESEIGGKGAQDLPSTVRSSKATPETVIRLLGKAATLLDQENTSEASAAALGLKQILASAENTAPAICSIIQESLDKAVLTSLLLADGGIYTYIVVAPNRHDHAHLIGRYAPFSAGWRRHAESLRSSLLASGNFRNLTAVLFFLSPEGKESIARLALATPYSIFMPSALAQSEDMSASNVRMLDTSFEFSLASQGA